MQPKPPVRPASKSTVISCHCCGHQLRRPAVGDLPDHLHRGEVYICAHHLRCRAVLSGEKEIEELAERAWRERLRITVRAERDEPHRPLSIFVRQPPAPFGHSL